MRSRESLSEYDPVSVYTDITCPRCDYTLGDLPVCSQASLGTLLVASIVSYPGTCTLRVKLTMHVV